MVKHARRLLKGVLIMGSLMVFIGGVCYLLYHHPAWFAAALLLALAYTVGWSTEVHG